MQNKYYNKNKDYKLLDDLIRCLDQIKDYNDYDMIDFKEVAKDYLTDSELSLFLKFFD